MEKALRKSLDQDESTRCIPQPDIEIRFLYLALNHVGAFERAVSGRGQSGLQSTVNSTIRQSNGSADS